MDIILMVSVEPHNASKPEGGSLMSAWSRYLRFLRFLGADFWTGFCVFAAFFCVCDWKRTVDGSVSNAD